MPLWDDYKAEAKSRGALALELFVAHSSPAAAPDIIKANLPAHLAYQAQLEAEGHLVMAGPLSDETGTHMQAMGMIVNGFIEPITKTLPMEYAVEWSRLIELQMEGSVG